MCGELREKQIPRPPRRTRNDMLRDRSRDVTIDMSRKFFSNLTGRQIVDSEEVAGRGGNGPVWYLLVLNHPS